jgi:hypothetical protein
LVDLDLDLLGGFSSELERSLLGDLDKEFLGGAGSLELFLRSSGEEDP